MKACVIPAGILALILGFSLWTGQYVESRAVQWNAILEEADKSAGQDDWTAARENLERAYADWIGSQTFLHTVMEHEELDKAENLFAGAAAMCREEERVEFRMLLAQLMKQIGNLSETQSMGIRNIL